MVRLEPDSEVVTETGSYATEYSVRDFLTILFKRKGIILKFALTVFIVATLASFLMSPTYEAGATILVKKARAEVPLVPKESAQLIISQVSENDLNSEIEILKSRQLIQEVLDVIGVDESWRETSLLGNVTRWLRLKLGAANLSYKEELLLHLQKELEVNAIRKSNIIQVSYRSNDPDWATQVVQILTERYLERRAQVYQTPQAESFFEEQMGEAKERLHQHEGALEEYLEGATITMVKSPQGTDSLAAQKQLVLQRLNQLQNDLAQTRATVREKEHTVSSLRDRLAQEPERLPSSNRFNQDATSEELERGLVALQLKRDELLQEFTPDNRRVRDIDIQIERAEERFRQAREQVGSINQTEVNPVHREIMSELIREEAGLEGQRARLASLRSQVASYSQELDDLNEKAFGLENLRREAQAAEEAYLLYRKKHEEARISAAMDQHKIINVSIAQPAEKPLKPVAPRKTLNMALALFLGIFGGLGLAFFMEYVDHSFTTDQDVVRRLGITHLGSVPEDEIEFSLSRH